VGLRENPGTIAGLKPLGGCMQGLHGMIAGLTLSEGNSGASEGWQAGRGKTDSLLGISWLGFISETVRMTIIWFLLTHLPFHARVGGAGGVQPAQHR
jgi:hypothetical protein